MVHNARLYRKVAGMPSTPAHIAHGMRLRAAECMHCARVIRDTKRHTI